MIFDKDVTYKVVSNSNQVEYGSISFLKYQNKITENIIQLFSLKKVDEIKVAELLSGYLIFRFYLVCSGIFLQNVLESIHQTSQDTFFYKVFNKICDSLLLEVFEQIIEGLKQRFSDTNIAFQQREEVSCLIMPIDVFCKIPYLIWAQIFNKKIPEYDKSVFHLFFANSLLSFREILSVLKKTENCRISAIDDLIFGTRKITFSFIDIFSFSFNELFELFELFSFVYFPSILCGNAFHQKHIYTNNPDLGINSPFFFDGRAEFSIEENSIPKNFGYRQLNELLTSVDNLNKISCKHESFDYWIFFFPTNQEEKAISLLFNETSRVSKPWAYLALPFMIHLVEDWQKT